MSARAATLLLVALLSAAAVRAEVPVPPLTARVTDLTATLTPSQRDTLERRLADFEKRKGSQIAVLLVPSTAPETIEQYAIRVAEQRKLGRKGVDDGALLLVAKNDRKLRLEIGYGLEGAIPDAVAKRIVAETITPQFKRGDFAGGIEAGVEQLIRAIDGEALAPAAAPEHRGSDNDRFAKLIDIAPVLFIAIFVAGGILRAIFGRLIGASLAGSLVGAIAWIMTGVIIGSVAGVLAFVLVLAAGTTIGRGGSGGWSSGGGWSGGGSSGGGSGGFSGGGGGFGGGGASGSW